MDTNTSQTLTECTGTTCPVKATGDYLDGLTWSALKAEAKWWRNRAEELEAYIEKLGGVAF